MSQIGVINQEFWRNPELTSQTRIEVKPGESVNSEAIEQIKRFYEKFLSVIERDEQDGFLVESQIRTLARGLEGIRHIESAQQSDFAQIIKFVFDLCSPSSDNALEEGKALSTTGYSVGIAVNTAVDGLRNDLMFTFAKAEEDQLYLRLSVKESIENLFYVEMIESRGDKMCPYNVTQSVMQVEPEGVAYYPVITSTSAVVIHNPEASDV